MHPTVFSYTTVAADPQLRPWIRGCWEFRVSASAPSEHHVPPDGQAFVVLVESGPGPARVFAYGPRIEPLVVRCEPGASYRGLRLAPEAAPLLVEVAAEVLCRAPVPVTRLGPVAADDVCSALVAGPLAQAQAAVDRLFLPHIGKLAPPDPVVVSALQAIRGSSGRIQLTEVAAAVGVAPRTLLRRIRAATGLTPKQHARIARFVGAAHGMLEPGSRLSHIAARGGYADQPHLSHEVSSLTGLTPGQLAERVRRTAHRFDD